MTAIGNCPWCGGEGIVVAGTSDLWVACNAMDCGATGPSGRTNDLAITAWNRLATPGQGEVPTDLDALAALAREATPGPWQNNRGGNVGSQKANKLIVSGDYNAPSDKDAAYIAAANPAVVLALIERVQRAEAALERMQNPRPEFWCEDAGRYDRSECRWPSCACKDKGGNP